MDKAVNTLCFLARGDKFLIAKHSTGMGRWWNGVGGPSEPGETRRQAACRKIRLDLGVWVEPADIRELRMIKVDGIDLAIMTAEKWQGEPRGAHSSVRDIRWASLGEMPWVEMYPGSEQWLPDILKLHFSPDLRRSIAR